MDSSSRPASCSCQLGAGTLQITLYVVYPQNGFKMVTITGILMIDHWIPLDLGVPCFATNPNLVSVRQDWQTSLMYSISARTPSILQVQMTTAYKTKLLNFLSESTHLFMILSHLYSTNHRLPNIPNWSKQRFTPLLQCISLSNCLVKISLKSITALKLWQKQIIDQLGAASAKHIHSLQGFFVTQICLPHPGHGTQVGFNQSFFSLLVGIEMNPSRIILVLVGVPTSPFFDGNLIHIE